MLRVLMAGYASHLNPALIHPWFIVRGTHFHRNSCVWGSDMLWIRMSAGLTFMTSLWSLAANLSHSLSGDTECTAGEPISSWWMEICVNWTVRNNSLSDIETNSLRYHQFYDLYQQLFLVPANPNKWLANLKNGRLETPKTIQLWNAHPPATEKRPGANVPLPPKQKRPAGNGKSHSLEKNYSTSKML